MQLIAKARFSLLLDRLLKCRPENLRVMALVRLSLSRSVVDIYVGNIMADQKIDMFKGILPGEPLYKMAPTRDENGQSFVDFMLIIPKLKKKPQEYIDRTLKDIQMVLNQYSRDVVFANMDLKINCLWVSYKPKPGLCKELIEAIRRYVPEAMLVGDVSR